MQNILDQGLVPTPNGATWEAIRSYYELKKPVHYDAVLSKVEWPQGWVVKDISERHATLVDHMGKGVAKLFIKQTPYDYYGNIWWSEDRLRALEILPALPDLTKGEIAVENIIKNSDGNINVSALITGNERKAVLESLKACDTLDEQTVIMKAAIEKAALKQEKTSTTPGPEPLI